MEIAYLPALYAAFSARETEVTLLGTRAGMPAWGPEILARSHCFAPAGELPDLLRQLGALGGRSGREPHQLPDSLMWFRSPEP